MMRLLISMFDCIPIETDSGYINDENFQLLIKTLKGRDRDTYSGTCRCSTE